MGILSAVKNETAVDYAATMAALWGLSIPNFWLGILLILLFSVELGLLPASRFVSPAESLSRNLATLVMPAFVLGNAIAAVIMRHTRSAMLGCLAASTCARVSRAKTGIRDTPIAIMALIRLGPRKAASALARIRNGIASEAARALGNPDLRILFRHILPNVFPPILVQATLAIAAAIIAEASLSFLGLGQQPPAPSWGNMLNTAGGFLSQAPWMAVWPGLAIFGVVLSFNLLGDGLRDAFDPRRG